MESMSLTEVFFPIFSLGTLVTGMVTFGLLANDRRNHGMYWGIFVLLLVSIVSISFDTIVLIIGGLHGNFPTAVQFSRLHEIATTAFVPAIPLFFALTLPATHWQRRASIIATWLGCILFLLVLVVAFVAPDGFVSVTQQSPFEMSAAYTNSFGRGAEGPLFAVRDIVFGFVILFSLFVASSAALDGQIAGPDLLILAGITIGVLFGASALYANFTGRYPGPLAGVPFSRVGLGLTVFTLLSTASYVLRYTVQAKLLDERNRELQHRRDRLAFLTYHDETTQLPNTQAFIRDMEVMVRNGQAGTAYMVDVTDFRDVLDTYGSAVSDRILRTVGRRIDQVAQQFGGTGTRVYSLSNDRFAVTTHGTISRNIGDLLEENLFDAISQPISVEEHPIYLAANAGRCEFTPDTTGPDDLLRRLRHALAEARRTKVPVASCRGDMEFAPSSSHELSQAIRHALRHGEFSLQYQPVVDRRGRVVAAEALLRWDRAGPDQFIPVAEDTGLIVPLTRAVFEILERDIPNLLLAVPDLCIYINISARDITRLEPEKHLSDMISRLNLAPESIGVEITETSFDTQTDGLVRVIQSLRDSGFAVAIDDFGTGYSSLAYLKRLPADRLKIDRIFIRDLPSSRDDAALVDSVVVLARRLARRIVAEGVETRAQYEYLRTRDIDFFQGFYFAAPMSRDDFIWTVAPAMELE